MSQYQFQFQSTTVPVPQPQPQPQPQANTEQLDGKSYSNYSEDSSYDDTTTIGSESKKTANSATASNKTSKTAAGDGREDGDGETPKLTFDWIVSNKLGEFGKYQKRIYFLLGLPAMVCAMHALSWVFLGANVKYR